MIEEYSSLILNLLIATLVILNISFWLTRKYLTALGGLIGILTAILFNTFFALPKISFLQTFCTSETTLALCALSTHAVVLIILTLLGHALGWIAEEIKASKTKETLAIKNSPSK